MLRSFLRLVAVAAILLLTAREAAADETDARPVRFASVEFNPLALVVHQVGGQVQVGVVGPLSLVAGASHLSLGDDQRWDSYDETWLGSPTLRGWLYEAGPRLSFPIRSRRAGRPPLYLWGGASFAYDDLVEGGVVRSTSSGPSHSITRVDGAVSTGVTWRLPGGFYLQGGLGLVVRHASTAPVDRAPGPFPIKDPQRGSWSPQLLFSVGWGI